MSPLRSKFISYLQLRGLTDDTVKNYVQAIKQFQDWLGKSPVHMTRESALHYLDYLKNTKKLAPRTINIHIYALKRFCDFFLPETGIMDPFARLHTPKHQPRVVSSEDVRSLIKTAPNLKVKAIIMTIYSAGLRISECLNLQCSDIDSKRQVIHVMGKGRKERYALLSPQTLEVLREYYRQRRPKDYLFPGYKPHAPLSGTAAARAIRTTARAAGIRTRVTAHVLRHSFATHLLERGESLLVIQKLLGHANVSTTAMYTQVSTRMLQEVKSPLDQPPPASNTHTDNKEKPESRRKPGRPKGTTNKRKKTDRVKRTGTTRKKEKHDKRIMKKTRRSSKKIPAKRTVRTRKGGRK